MLKLITPTQYESALDGLNAVRPLSLADRGKLVLDIPVCNSNPVNAGRPGLGKLLRCNQLGALLFNGRFGYENYEIIRKTFNAANDDQHIAFTQKVYSVLCHTISYNRDITGRWSDPTYSIIFYVIDERTDDILDFVGTDLYIAAGGMSGWEWIVDFYGFY